MPYQYDRIPTGTPLTEVCAGGATTALLEIVDHTRRAVAHIDGVSFPSGHAGYNCRNVNGRYGPIEGRPSVHATGGAFDWMLAASDPVQKSVGDAIADWLVANADVLGVQGVIWNHRQWGFGVWSWRPTGRGQHPHHDHVHGELNKAGRSRNGLEIRALLETLPPILEHTLEPEPAERVDFVPVPGARRDADGLIAGWWAHADGQVDPVYGAPEWGDAVDLELDEPIVELVPYTDGAGYWLVAADGGVHNRGHAPYPADHPAMMATIDTAGGLVASIAGASFNGTSLVLYARDGGIFPLPIP